MIPYEAISEASMAIDDEAYKIIGWEGVKRMLEAATPHIAADAWDHCAASIVDEHGNPIIPDSNTNPYRNK